MAVNKVVMNTANGEETLIDLTEDTVTADTLTEGVTAHDASGARIVGTFPASEIQAQLDILNADVAEIKTDYATKQDVSINYVTKQSISTVLADYARKADVESTYATKTELSNYPTMQSVSTALANYATKSYVDTAVAGAGQDIYRHEIRFYYNSSGRIYDILVTIYNKTSTPYPSAYAFNNNFLLKEGTYGYGFYIPATGIYRQSSSASIYGVHKMCYGGDPLEIVIGLNSISGNTISTFYIDTSECTFTDRVLKMT